MVATFSETRAFTYRDHIEIRVCVLKKKLKIATKDYFRSKKN